MQASRRARVRAPTVSSASSLWSRSDCGGRNVGGSAATQIPEGVPVSFQGRWFDTVQTRRATRVPSAKTREIRLRQGGQASNSSQLVEEEGQMKGSQQHKSKASRQRAHHRGGKTRRRTPNAFEASCRQAAGPRIRGFGWQMRKMRRRPNQLQASPCIIRDELLQIACCRSGVARRTRKDDSKSPAPPHARRDMLRPLRLLHLIKLLLPPPPPPPP
ncbi:hypothetical protein PMIN03_003745 [Paraphaeosphaeria minitans]